MRHTPTPCPAYFNGVIHSVCQWEGFSEILWGYLQAAFFMPCISSRIKIYLNPAHAIQGPLKKRWKNYPRLATEQEAGQLPLQSKTGLLFAEEQKTVSWTGIAYKGPKKPLYSSFRIYYLTCIAILGRDKLFRQPDRGCIGNEQCRRRFFCLKGWFL